jgi:hypothetical protein
MGGRGIFHYNFFLISTCVPEGKTNFINGSTGTVVDPNGPSTRKDKKVRDKKVVGWRGMGDAPGYDDLAGVVQNPRLHADHARHAPTLIVSSAEEGKGTSGKTKE